MVNKFKRGLTAEEAALIASSLERFDSLLDAKRTLQSEEDSVMAAEAELTNPYNDMGYASMSWDEVNAHNVDFYNLNEAEQIYEALLDEVSIACHWDDFLSGKIELYDNGIPSAPSSETPLKAFQVWRNAPDDEYSYCPIPRQTTITKISLAKWFEAHLPDKANLFDPSESYKSIETGYSMTQINKQENTNPLPVTTSQQTSFSDQIINTNAWKDLYKLTEKAVGEFPNWQKTRPKPNSISKDHIRDWLINTVKMPTREAEIVKKVLDEIFNL